MRKRSAEKHIDHHLSKLSMLLGTALIIVALYFGRDILIPLALATLLTFVFTPLADWLERRRVPHAAAAVGVVLVMCCATLGLGYVVGDQIVGFAQNLSNYQDEIGKKIKVFQGGGNGLIDKVTRSVDEMQRAASDDAPKAATQDTATAPTNVTQSTGKELADVGRGMQVAPASRPTSIGTDASNPVYVLDANAKSPPLGNLTAYLGIVLGPLGTAGLVLVLVLFMLLERDDLRDRFIRLISGGKYTLATQAINDATTRVSRYLRALLIVNGTYGVAIATGLYLIGLIFGGGLTFPSFILWGVLCAVLRFIPYVGPWVAAVFPIAVSLAVYPGFGVFFAVLAMFVVIELISNNFMEPILYGSSTGLSTVALLVAALIWTALWGPYGLLLSTPLTVCLIVLGKHVPQLGFLDVLLGDQPALPPSVRLYQRLLAGNFADAQGVAAEAGKEEPDAAVLGDRVIVPALQMARRDRLADEMTAADEGKLYDHVSRIIAETGAARAEEAADDAKQDGKPAAATATTAGPLIVGLPAHHRSETLVVQALGELVRPRGARVEQLSCSLLPADVESRIADVGPAAVVVAVLPPGGTTQARYLCRRLRRRFKDLTIVVAYLGKYRDYDRLLVRFRAAGASYVTTSLEQTRAQLTNMLHLTLPDAAAAEAARAGGSGADAGSLCGPESTEDAATAGTTLHDERPRP